VKLQKIDCSRGPPPLLVPRQIGERGHKPQAKLTRVVYTAQAPLVCLRFAAVHACQPT